MKLLILGSKEYPPDANKDDPLPSGGMEVHVKDLIRELSKQKDIEIAIITRRFMGMKKYEKKGKVEVFRTPWIKGFYFRNITFNFFAFVKGLSLNFDLIHSHGLISTTFGLMLAKVKGKPLVATPHGLAFHQQQYPSGLRYILKLMEKFAYSRSKCVFFLSDQERGQFRKKLNFLPDRYEVTRTGVDFEKFVDTNPTRIRREFQIRNKVLITFVGRLIDVKGVGYLLKAIKGVKGEGYAILIVGKGPIKERLKSLAKNLDLRDKIIFTDFRSDVPDILAATDIFVLPSLSEGLPITLLEAMTSSNACIVTDIGLPVEDRRTALVVPPKDPKRLCEAIEILLKDQKLRKRLGENAKKEVRKKFSWSGVVQKHMEIFKTLLNKR